MAIKNKVYLLSPAHFAYLDGLRDGGLADSRKFSPSLAIQFAMPDKAAIEIVDLWMAMPFPNRISPEAQCEKAMELIEAGEWR